MDINIIISIVSYILLAIFSIALGGYIAYRVYFKIREKNQISKICVGKTTFAKLSEKEINKIIDNREGLTCRQQQKN